MLIPLSFLSRIKKMNWNSFLNFWFDRMHTPGRELKQETWEREATLRKIKPTLRRPFVTLAPHHTSCHTVSKILPHTFHEDCRHFLFLYFAFLKRLMAAIRSCYFVNKTNQSSLKSSRKTLSARSLARRMSLVSRLESGCQWAAVQGINTFDRENVFNVQFCFFLFCFFWDRRNWPSRQLVFI